MFWKLTALSSSSPVESILDKENFTLEELLDEEEIIQECKSLNSRLIKFLRDPAQVEQLLRYIIEESPEDAENKRAFKFPFIACEIFTCEIDVILKTLVEEEELMNLLFSFLEPDRQHSALLAGYFSKVVVCLMIRKTIPLMNYVQAHQNILRQLIDLIGITSIMEVLVRLLGADDHVYPNFIEVMQWLAESDVLEMIVDKLCPSSPPEVHANAAETLSAVTRNMSSPLAIKLSSPSFVARIFDHALGNSTSHSGLVHSLSVCISLLDPKRSAVSSPLFHSFPGQIYESSVPINPETVNAMLPRLGDLLKLLSLSSDEKILPTTYGQLKPPLGKHRLKIIEFFAVLLRSRNEIAENELVNSGTICRVIDLFFEYPYNNLLHHHVEIIILSCLESKNDAIIDHILGACDLIGKILQADNHPLLACDANQPTLPATGKQAPRSGNLGHITRIANKLVQIANNQSGIRAFLQEINEWNEWQATVLQERNAIENVLRWGCGRPTALQDRTRDSDDDDLHERDYDVEALANNLSQAFRYKIYGNDETEEDHAGLDRDDEDVYFDDESAEVVISSLRLGDDQGSLFTNSNWFAFQDSGTGTAPLGSSPAEGMDEISLNGTINGGNSSSDDEVMVGEDEELAEKKGSVNDTSCSSTSLNGLIGNSTMNGGEVFNLDKEKSRAVNDMGFFRFETTDNEDLFGDRPIPDWVGWGESPDMQVGGSNLNPFQDQVDSSDATPSSKPQPVITSHSPSNGKVLTPNGSSKTIVSGESSAGGDSSRKSPTVPSLFEEDVEFVGVELEGTEKAMEQALKEGIVGEAGPLKRNSSSKRQEKDDSDEGGPGLKEFNDANYWRVEQEVAVLE